METFGYLGALYLNDGASIAFTTEAMSTSDELVYTISDSDKKYWDPDSTLTVYKNGNPITSGFTIRYIGGMITFSVANNPLDVITVSGKSFNLVEAGGFYKWTVNIERNEVDLNKFGNNGWAEKKTVIGSWSATAERFYLDETYFDLLGEKSLFIFYVDEASQIRYEGYGYIKKDSIDSTASEVIKESLEITGTDKIYYLD